MRKATTAREKTAARKRTTAARLARYRGPRELKPVEMYQLLLCRRLMRRFPWWPHHNFMEIARRFEIPVTTLRSRYERQMRRCGNDREAFDRALDDFERTSLAKNMSQVDAALAALEKNQHQNYFPTKK